MSDETLKNLGEHLDKAAGQRQEKDQHQAEERRKTEGFQRDARQVQSKVVMPLLEKVAEMYRSRNFHASVEDRNEAVALIVKPNGIKGGTLRIDPDQPRRRLTIVAVWGEPGGVGREIGRFDPKDSNEAAAVIRAALDQFLRALTG